MISVLVLVASAVAVILGFLILGKRRRTDNLSSIRRKMSVSSKAIYQNVFPDEAEIMSIMNLELVMSRIPSKDEFVSLLMEVFSEDAELGRLRSRVERVGFDDYRFTEVKDLKARLLQVVHVEIVPDDDAMSALIEKITGTEMPLDGILHSYYLIQNQVS
mmetsp:Transcript_25467/g.100560  ORF Transcript_25467/g.100560 Transcript_25467/m.100560 type:complete len:160 (+) Transcript_25467:157-636(+)